MIDIGASAKAEEKRIPAVWHLPAVVILAWLCFLPGMRRWVQEEAANILVPGMALLTAGLFWVLHIWTNRRRCDAYSENTQINTAIHVRERRMWGMDLACGNIYKSDRYGRNSLADFP